MASIADGYVSEQRRPHRDVLQPGQRVVGREVERAAQIQHDNPSWMVMFGNFSREYVAFPLFPVPPGLVLSDKNPADLAARLPEVQKKYDNSVYRGAVTWV
jgi:hypothetical protein